MTTGMVEVYFHNFGSVEATVKCTLNAGNRFGGFGSIAGSVTIAAGENALIDDSILWMDVDKVDSYGSYNFSCILPPNLEINTITDVNRDVDDRL